MFSKVSYMWSELTDSKPQCVHTDFDSEVVEESNQSLWSHIRCSRRNDVACLDPHCKRLCPQAKKETEERINQKHHKEKFKHYFLYIPRGILLWIQGNAAHAGGFCFGQTGLKRKKSPFAFLLLPQASNLKRCWRKEKSQPV